MHARKQLFRIHHDGASCTIVVHAVPVMHVQDACPRCMHVQDACAHASVSVYMHVQDACPHSGLPSLFVICIGVRRGSSGQGCFRSSIDGQGLSSHLSSSAFICLLICLLICLHLSSSLCLCVSFNIWMREGMGA